MDVEKVFSDLESNQTYECEESKKKLVELFTQYKDQWFVHYMMDYYYKTGSQRIMEVLVKVQPPHDTYMFDRLVEWLKSQTHRVQALNLFCFVVRKHPTWLYKVEKHRLIKDIFKLLLAEKEIVPLMSALLCIITLLPIIPNLVPNLFNDLFEVFGHLASWNWQNPNRLPEDKLVHLQLGLQMLFHRLYGMYPCNFLTYLSEFHKKEKGAIFHHTIQPLLETVRVHPMLVTATTETEVNHTRWKEKEPHDIVEECAQLSFSVLYQDLNVDQSYRFVPSDLLDTPGGTQSMFSLENRTSSTNLSATNTHYMYSNYKEQQKLRGGPVSRFDSEVNLGGATNSSIWSPYNEIAMSGPIPLTPTPSYMLPLPTSTSGNNQLLGATGSSPPEAAVEATPETTPMKDMKEMKQQHGVVGGMSALPNPHAVRAIFASSQPSSPLRKEQHNQFNFSDLVPMDGGTMSTTTQIEQEVNMRVVTRISTNYDRRLQQVIQDRTRSQSPFQTIEALSAKHTGSRSPCEINSKSETPEMDTGDACSNSHLLNSAVPTPAATPTPNLLLTPTPTPTPTPLPAEPITKICDNCNETERSLCTSGGLQIPTSRSMQLMLVKGIKRRNRMASYCYNDSSSRGTSTSRKDELSDGTRLDGVKVRRTKSCSAICPSTSVSRSNSDDDSVGAIPPLESIVTAQNRLQKSGKMLAIATATKKLVNSENCVNVATQTIEIATQNYENLLFHMLLENAKYSKRNLLYPHQILDTYMSIIRSKESCDGGRSDQEQYQLLCLQLQYERYRRDIHAERNRRLMGRSRDKRSLEMERDRLREQLKNVTVKNKEFVQQIDKNMKMANEREQALTDELLALKKSYQNELERNQCLRQANEDLKTRLNEELTNRRDMNYKLEALRGQIFNMNSELEHAQVNADMGLQCKQELARIEAEFIVMGEVQVKCRDRMAELDNYKLRDEELQMLQTKFNMEHKEMKYTLEERSSQLDSAKHKIAELQAQLINNEKVITEQKRLLKAAKDEYEEKFKSLNKKYDVQKIIIRQMEEKIVMSLHKPQTAITLNTCSPDTDKTDVASSMDRNSPLSTSLASSESLSASLRSTEMRNLQQLVETPVTETGSSSISVVGVGAGSNIIEGKRLPAPDLASSASTATATSASAAISAASAINIMPGTTSAAATASAAAAHDYDLASATMSHTHPHVHLQQQQQKQPQKLKPQQKR